MGGTFKSSVHRLPAWCAALLILFALAACSGGGGGGDGGGQDDDLPGAVAVDVDISLLGGLDPADAIVGSLQCPGGGALPMEIDNAGATATCGDLDPGLAEFVIRFDYQPGGSPVTLALAVRSFEVVSGETRTLEFALTAADLADDNDDGVSNLNDLLLLQDLGVSAFLSGLTLACADPTLPSCHNLTLIVPAGQATPPPGFLAGAAVSGLTDYTSTQSALVEAITVTPTALGPGATITVNGNEVTSGAASDPVPLNVDETVITIVVTSADGFSEVTYRVFVTSQAQFDADLVALSLSAGTLAPVFARDTTAYTATVDFDIENITLTVTTSQPAATLRVNNTQATSGAASEPQPLGIGPNPIDVTVTAPDGATLRTYSITVTRIGSAQLSALTITGITEELQQVGLSLDPAFQSGTPDYISDAENRIVEATVTATARAEGALIEINGVAGASRTLPLAVGSNPVVIVVTHPTSGTGSPLQFEYSVDLVRQPPPQYLAEAYLKPSIAGPGFHLGTAIALSAAGDEVHGITAAVGAPEEDDGVGVVYVYTRNGSGEWSQQARLVPDDSDERYNFGRSVALSESGNTLVVGAPGWDFVREFEDGEEISGVVHVFTRTGNGDWVAQGAFAAFNASELDGFGYSVALSGNTLAVGAPGESSGQGGVFAPGGTHADSDARGSGAVYVYTFSGGWNLQAFIKSPLPADAIPGTISERFGWSVALSGESDQLTLAVGMPGDSGSAPPPLHGTVHLYTREDSNWDPAPDSIVGPTTTANSQFGWTLALSADGDTLAVGVPTHSGRTEGVWNGADGPDVLNNGQTSQGPLRSDSGAVHVFTRTGGPWIEQTFIKASNSLTGFRFGFGLALSGGGDTLAIGAPGEDSAATTVDGNQQSTSALDSGAVYTFAREDQRWAQTAYIKVPNSRAGIGFGASVAMTANGGLIAGGAPGESSGTGGVVMDTEQFPIDGAAPDRGAAYIFRSNAPGDD